MDTAGAEVQLLVGMGIDAGYARHLAHVPAYDLATEMDVGHPPEWGPGEALQTLMETPPANVAQGEGDRALRAVFLTRAAAQLGLKVVREDA